MCNLPGGERCELAKVPHHEPDPARGIVDAQRAIHSRLWNIAAKEMRCGVPGAGRCVGICSRGNQGILDWGLELHSPLLASSEWIAGRDGAVLCADPRRLSLGGDK